MLAYNGGRLWLYNSFNDIYPHNLRETTTKIKFKKLNTNTQNG